MDSAPPAPFEKKGDEMTRTQDTHKKSAVALLLAATAALALSACGQHEDGGGALGAHVDAAVGRVEQQAAQAPLSAQQQEAKSKEAAQDAAITAAIKAEFARDPALSALQIRIVTKEGLVSLDGKAPDAATRERATRVAVAVKDVLSVDNRMVLPG